MKWETFVLPIIEDVISKLADGTILTSIEAANGFYHITLRDDSQELTTFITPFSRYCFRRLPFGITSTPEIFMRKMLQLFKGLEGVFFYMDDVLVFGKDQEEYDRHLETVMNIVETSGLRLNKD